MTIIKPIGARRGLDDTIEGWAIPARIAHRIQHLREIHASAYRLDVPLNKPFIETTIFSRAYQIGATKAMVHTVLNRPVPPLPRLLRLWRGVLLRVELITQDGEVAGRCTEDCVMEFIIGGLHCGGAS